MQIIYDGRKVQVWEFVSQDLNIGKWSTGKHCDGVAVVKQRENHYVSRRWHPSFNFSAGREYAVAIVPSETVPGRMDRPGQKRPKISFLANNSGHRGRMLESLCRMMRFCNADIFIMH